MPTQRHAASEHFLCSINRDFCSLAIWTQDEDELNIEQTHIQPVPSPIKQTEYFFGYNYSFLNRVRLGTICIYMI